MRMRDEDGHHAMLKAGKVWAKVKEGQARLWSDWTMVLGPCLEKARAEAMAVAQTNTPMGRGYNTAMSGLLTEYKLDDMSETARAHMLKIMTCLPDVEAWRAKQADPGDLNHPSRVWAKYQKASKPVDEAAKAKRAKAKAEREAKDVAGLQEEIKQADDENQKLRDENWRLQQVIKSQEDQIRYLEKELVKLGGVSETRPSAAEVEAIEPDKPKRKNGKPNRDEEDMDANLKEIEDELNASLFGAKPKRRRKVKA